MDATERMAGLLRQQARWCAELGSPLYAGILPLAADDLLAGGPVRDVLYGHEHDPGRSMLALRFLGAVHRLVLSGRAPALARHYPSTGGTPGPSLWEDFRAAVSSSVAELRAGVEEPVQTNEAGRSAVLLCGFLSVAARHGRPLRLLEIGASAGLNLRFDRYRYVSGEFSWGPVSSPLVLRDFLATTSAPPPAVPLTVASRAGCDVSPIDLSSPEGRIRLESFVWPDQIGRLERLRAAVSLAAAAPVVIDRADAADWLPARLAAPAPGVATVVFHSVVWQYVPAPSRDRILAALAAAGAAATAEAPLVHLAFEQDDGAFELRATCWPGGSLLLATASPHGGEVALTDQSRSTA